MLPGMEEMTQEDNGAAARPASDRRKLCVMRSGARLFAVYADDVEATSQNLSPTPLPFAPAPVRGLVSQRGRILTVLDPLLLLPPLAPSTADAPTLSTRHDSPPARASAPLIVALRGDEQLALAVERIETDIELFDENETDTTTHAAPPGSHLCVRRTIQHHAGAIALLDTAHLFEAAMQGVERRRKRQ